MRALLPVIAAALAFFAADALAITKCIDKAGKVTYQDGKCPDDSKTDALKTPIPLSPPPMSSGSAESSGSSGSSGSGGSTEPTGTEDPAMMELAGTQSTFDNCDVASPGFTGRNGETYIGWRTQAGTLLSKWEATPEYQRAVENGRAKFRNNVVPSSIALQNFAKTCETQFLPGMKNALRK
ncbi:hypothetical protein DSM104443_01833 [Usitatibacter rugosus]|uniref:DUF4124 domain-containing protein n=1 Tax=Usitatibacter rugosus TaxID=2732067 RepID=A0A6M4GW89_9PROT|nr:hypothetical protein DSM104443_01833 [Usitatibacter rugosus]